MRCLEPGRLSDAAVAGIASGTLTPDQYQSELEHLDECTACQEWVESEVFERDARVDGFVASELLVARILQGSRRRTRASFRMPARLMEQGWPTEERVGVRRAAALVLASLGLTPGALAAAMVINILAFGAFGAWVGSMGRLVFLSDLTRRLPVSEHVVFIPLGLPAGQAKAGTTQQPGRALTRADSIQRARELRTRDSVLAAVNRQLFFASARDSISSADTLILGSAATMLRRFPAQAIKVTGESAVAGSDSLRIASGRAVAMRVTDFFAARGIRRSRITTTGTAWDQATCTPRARCPSGGARVTIHTVPPR